MVVNVVLGFESKAKTNGQVRPETPVVLNERAEIFLRHIDQRKTGGQGELRRSAALSDDRSDRNALVQFELRLPIEVERRRLVPSNRVTGETLRNGVGCKAEVVRAVEVAGGEVGNGVPSRTRADFDGVGTLRDRDEVGELDPFGEGVTRFGEGGTARIEGARDVNAGAGARNSILSRPSLARASCP